MRINLFEGINSDEAFVWIISLLIVCVTVVILGGMIGAYQEDQVTAKLIADVADPLAIKCTFDDTEGKLPVCIAYAVNHND